MPGQVPAKKLVPCWYGSAIQNIGNMMGRVIRCKGCSDIEITCETIIREKIWDDRSEQVKKVCFKVLSPEAARAIEELLARERNIKILRVAIPSLELELEVTIQNGH